MSTKKIDNMKYYSGSLAYDFERFAPREQRAEPARVLSMPRRAEKKQPAGAALTRLASRAVTVSLLVTLLAVVALNIYTRAEINRVHAAVNEAKKQYELAENEQARLLIEQDRRTSYKNLEKKARELGMQKRSTNQIEYIRTVSGNKALISADEQNGLDQLYSVLKNQQE